MCSKENPPSMLVDGCSYPRAERASIARNYYGRGLSFEERERAWQIAYVDSIADATARMFEEPETPKRESPVFPVEVKIAPDSDASRLIDTLLDADETSVRHYTNTMEPAERNEIMQLVSAECHRRHKKERRKTALALLELQMPRAFRRYMQCCSIGWITHSAKGRDGRHYFASVNRCRSRHCPLCSRIKAKIYAEKFREVFARLRAPRLITLTLRQVDGRSLTQTLNSLHRGWRRIKKSDRWQRYVRGGIAVIEVKQGKVGWNAHYHVVFDGKFYPHAELVEDWKQATARAKTNDSEEESGSFVVDIRKVRQDQLGKYLAKYIAKPAGDLNSDTLPEYITAMRGRRMFSAFGSLCGEASLRANEEDCSAMPDDAKPVGTLAHFVLRARVGDKEAQTILREAWPWFATRRDKNDAHET